MAADRIAALTPQQLACLRKVAEHKDSGVIAYELQIAKGTVDIHIAKAVAKLGVSSRREAARMLLEQQSNTIDRIDSDFLGIDRNAAFASGMGASEQSGSLLRDGEWSGPTLLTPPVIPSHPIGDANANRYDLNVPKILGLTALLVISACLIMIASIPMSSAVQDIADWLVSPSH